MIDDGEVDTDLNDCYDNRCEELAAHTDFPVNVADFVICRYEGGELFSISKHDANWRTF